MTAQITANVTTAYAVPTRPPLTRYLRRPAYQGPAAVVTGAMPAFAYARRVTCTETNRVEPVGPA